MAAGSMDVKRCIPKPNIRKGNAVKHTVPSPQEAEGAVFYFVTEGEDRDGSEFRDCVQRVDEAAD